MKKQPTSQRPIAKKTPVSAPKTAPKPHTPKSTERYVHKQFPNWIYVVIIAYCFLLYGNTMWNEFALDDTMVLTQNEFVKRGASGIVPIFKYDTFIGRYGEQVANLPGGRYRPLSVALLAVEYDIFVDAETKQIIRDKLDPSKTQYTLSRRYLSPELLARIDSTQTGITFNKTSAKQNDDDAPLYMKTLLPKVNHFMNILLYAIAACFLFKLLWRLFPVRETAGWKVLFNVPVIATLLFLAHPVHAEAVANIKGRDEIMTFLGALMALFYTMRWLDTRDKKFLIITFLCFLGGAFSKENAITFWLIIPLTAYFFTPYKAKEVFIAWLPSLLAGLVFLAVRGAVIDTSPLPETELMNNPFLGMRPYERWASIIYVLGRYLWLLIYPNPLTTDYYPYHIGKMNFSDIEVWLSLFVYLGLLIFILWGMLPSRKNRYAYAAIWYIVPLTIVSNVFVMIGTFMNERFVYISSVGFCMAIAYFLIINVPKWIKDDKLYHGLVVGFLVVVLGLYSVQTIARNRAWFDDFTLSTTDVKTSPESAKANYDAARVYNIKIQSEPDSAKRSFYAHQIFNYSKRAVEIHPRYEMALLLLSWSHSALGSPADSSVKYLLRLAQRNPQNQFVYDGLKMVLGKETPQKRAEVWEKVVAIAPNNFDANYNLACVYAKELGVDQNGQLKPEQLLKALPYFDKAVQLNPQAINGLIDLGAMYGNLGYQVKALETFEKASQVAPNEPLVWRNLWLTYNTLGETQKAQAAHQRYIELGGQ